MRASTSRRGAHSARILTTAFLPAADASAARRAVTSSSFIAGTKSHVACHDAVCGRSVITRLRSITTGPDRPKCVNRNEPRRKATGLAP